MQNIYLSGKFPDYPNYSQTPPIFKYLFESDLETKKLYKIIKIFLCTFNNAVIMTWGMIEILYTDLNPYIGDMDVPLYRGLEIKHLSTPYPNRD